MSEYEIVERPDRRRTKGRKSDRIDLVEAIIAAIPKAVRAPLNGQSSIIVAHSLREMLKRRGYLGSTKTVGDALICWAEPIIPKNGAGPA